MRDTFKPREKSHPSSNPQKNHLALPFQLLSSNQNEDTNKFSENSKHSGEEENIEYSNEPILIESENDQISSANQELTESEIHLPQNNAFDSKSTKASEKNKNQIPTTEIIGQKRKKSINPLFLVKWDTMFFLKKLYFPLNSLLIF